MADASSKPLSVAVPIVAGIGNALMAVPMVRQLRRGNVARVTILARTNAMAEPFRRLPEVDETIVTGTGAKNLIRSILTTRRLRADVYLVPFPSNRWQYSLLAFASAARRRILHSYPVGYWQTLAFLPSERIPGIRGLHDVVQNLKLLERLNIVPDLHDAPSFALRDEDRSAATALLTSAGVNDAESFVAIHAGSARTILAQAKRWPAESYAELIRRLRSSSKQVVLFEGPDETGVANEIVSRLDPPDRSSQPVIRLTGPLGEAAAVLERAAIYVGSDSGLAHLAAAVGTPPVTIFAPADPDRVSPFGYRALVVQPPTACTPCFQYPWECPYPKMKCSPPMCVTLVTVDAVFQTAKRAMSDALERKLATDEHR